MNIPTPTPPRVHYPDSDGLPMADNTLQFRWIVTIQGNLDALFRNDPNVFVAGDLLWYPVEGDNKTRAAPDAMVVFGRPKGDRGSYRQWEEGGTPPQVVFEVASPGNRFGEMMRRFRFFERFGVEEYYYYDPDRNTLEGWLRSGNALEEIEEPNGWVSPRLGIRFDLSGPELQIFTPAGERFLTYVQLAEQRDAEWVRAEQERARAEQERKAREAAEARAEQLAARLRALGIDPDAPQV